VLGGRENLDEEDDFREYHSLGKTVQIRGYMI
jgi:hypothetical protein